MQSDPIPNPLPKSNSYPLCRGGMSRSSELLFSACRWGSENGAPQHAPRSRCLAVSCSTATSDCQQTPYTASLSLVRPPLADLVQRQGFWVCQRTSSHRNDSACFQRKPSVISNVPNSLSRLQAQPVYLVNSPRGYSWETCYLMRHESFCMPRPILQSQCHLHEQP